MRRSAALLLLLLGSFVSGCNAVQRYLETPLETFEYRPDGKRSDTLIVFLPGIFDPAETFARHGIMQAVRDAGIDADMVAVDANVRYYGQGRIVERLRRDVVGPAVRRGYGRIVLVGTSLGGLGALLYARAHPTEIDSVLLIAPLLPDESAGRRDAGVVLERRNRSDLWAWLESRRKTVDPSPKLFLSYGDEDKFAAINGRLAALLPPERVDRAPGEHDWSTWTDLWQRALARGWLTESGKQTEKAPIAK